MGSQAALAFEGKDPFALPGERVRRVVEGERVGHVAEKLAVFACDADGGLALEQDDESEPFVGGHAGFFFG